MPQAAVPQCLTFAEFKFDWSSSGDTTFTHNYNLSTRQGVYPVNIDIQLGNAYVSAMTKDAFTITAASASGHGIFTCEVSAGDYP